MSDLVDFDGIWLITFFVTAASVAMFLIALQWVVSRLWGRRPLCTRCRRWRTWPRDNLCVFCQLELS